MNLKFLFFTLRLAKSFRNPQSDAYCRLLGIPNRIFDAAMQPLLEPFNSVDPSTPSARSDSDFKNPDELQIDFDE